MTHTHVTFAVPDPPTGEPGTAAWLYERATQLKVPNRGSMNKTELAAAVSKAEALPYGRHLDSKELAAAAKDLGLKGYSKLSRDELAPVVYEAASARLSPAEVPAGPRGPVNLDGRQIGTCALVKRPGIQTALYLQRDRALAWITWLSGGAKPRMEDWERDSWAFTFDSFQPT